METGNPCCRLFLVEGVERKVIMNWTPIKDINFGEIDARNYTSSHMRDFFNNIFLPAEKLEEIKKPTKYFLIGEKGTGKTAYAVFLGKNDKSKLVHIRSTDYRRFIALKKNDDLPLSDDYSDVWELILLFIVASQLRESYNSNAIAKRIKFHAISRLIDEYHKKSTDPQVKAAIQVVQEASKSAGIVAKLSAAEIDLKSGNTITTTSNFSTWHDSIRYLIGEFKNALEELRQQNECLIFIDGIDIRPKEIEYNDYIECICGLISAVLHLNQDFFQENKNLRNIRIVALLRPDIIDTLKLQNLNAKMIDNSVVLNWVIPRYDEYRSSYLFRVFDRLLERQQKLNPGENLKFGESWDHYFPYKIKNYISGEIDGDDSFVDFIRFSFHRPRDIIMMLKIAQKHCPANTKHCSKFPHINMADPRFQEEYSEYLKGEINDSLFFYHHCDAFETFYNFFPNLKPYIDQNSRIFSYDDFLVAFSNFNEYCAKHSLDNSSPIFKTADIFLQSMFELNMFCYLDPTHDEIRRPNIHWYFRERTSTRVNPRVRYGVKYKFHKGLAFAYDIL